MLKRKLKSRIGLFLLMLMSIGLTISTLHSHHHLDWTHPPDFADTGNCLTADTTLCPISGYLFQMDLPAASQSGSVFFRVEDIIVESVHFVTTVSTVVHPSRAPPSQA